MMASQYSSILSMQQEVQDRVRKTEGKLMMILGEHDEQIDNGRCTAIFNEMRNVKHKKHIVLGP